jgi:hypothetical protein
MMASKKVKNLFELTAIAELVGETTSWGANTNSRLYQSQIKMINT